MERNLTDEIFAEFQIGIRKKVKLFMKNLKETKKIKKLLKKSNFLHKVNENGEIRFLKYPIKIAGITSYSKKIENIWGIIYGIHSYAILGDYKGKNKIRNLQPFSNFRLNDCMHVSNQEIIFYNAYRNFFDLISELITIKDLKLILIDQPILLTREFQISSADMSLQRQWFEFKGNLNNFWEKNIEKLYPLNKEGPIICLLQRKNYWNIRDLLNSHNIIDNFNKLSEDFINKINDTESIFNKINLLTIIFNTLENGYRTVCLNLITEGIEKRWEPKILEEIGVLTWYFKPFLKREIWNLQVLGNFFTWSSKKIDGLCNLIREITFSSRKQNMPFPLWLARLKSQFSSKYLQYFKDRIEKEMKESGF